MGSEIVPPMIKRRLNRWETDNCPDWWSEGSVCGEQFFVLKQQWVEEHEPDEMFEGVVSA